MLCVTLTSWFQSTHKAASVETAHVVSVSSSVSSASASRSVQEDEVILSPDGQKEFCSRIQDIAGRVLLEARKVSASPSALAEVIRKFRLKVDKCDEKVMQSPAVCQFFSELPAASAEAFAPIYGGNWDGWGIWIKQECVLPMLARGDAGELTRLRAAFEETLGRLSKVVPFEEAGLGKTELMPHSLLLDGLNGIASKGGEAELEKQLGLVELRVPTVRKRLAAAKSGTSKQ